MPGAFRIASGNRQTLPVLLDHRPAVAGARTAAPTRGKHRGPGRAAREMAAPADPGGDLLSGARRDRLAGPAGRVSASGHRLRLLRPLGESRRLAARPRRAAGSAAPGPG